MKPPVNMNLEKIRRLMKKYGLFCPIRKANPYRRMAKAMATSYVAPNLVNREFEVQGPRKILLTDITYIINGKAPRVCTTFEQVCKVVSDWTDYYNNERYQWDLAKLSPAEFYEYCITGQYPLTIPKPKGKNT